MRISAKTLLSCAIFLVPSLGLGAPANIQNQATTLVEASPLKPSERPPEEDVQAIEAETTPGVGLGYGSALGTGSGGYGEGSSDFYGDSNYGYTSDGAASGAGDSGEAGDLSRTSRGRGAYGVASKKTVEVVPVIQMKDPEYYVDWRVYVAALGGIVDNHGLVNATPRGAGGLGLGVFYNDNLSIDGSFIYSYQETTHAYCNTTNTSCGTGTDADVVGTNLVDQYMFGLGAKYYIDFGSKLLPFVGVVGHYTYRKHFSDVGGQERTSQAFDGGGSAGLDYKVNQNLRFGVAWSYLKNMRYELDGPSTSSSTGSLREVSQSSDGALTDYEQTDYQVWMANLKWTF